MEKWEAEMDRKGDCQEVNEIETWSLMSFIWELV